MKNIIDIKFAETHTPLFLAGQNLGSKLDITKRQGLLLQYDFKKEFLLVWIKEHLSLVPKETVVNLIALNPSDTGYTHPTIEVEQQKPQQSASPNPKIVAQVSTPQSHVFGDGPGETGVGQRIK